MRALSGVGLALACPAGFGLVSDLITHEPARSRVFAAFGLGGPIGASSGTILGGGIAGIPTRVRSRAWSYLFLILAGLGVIPMTIGYCIFPEKLSLPKPGVLVQMDWVGGFLVTAGFTLFMFSMVQSGIVNKGWREPYIPTLFVVSIILLVSFFFWERRVERRHSLDGQHAIAPAVKVSLLSMYRHRFTAILLASFLTFYAAAGWVYAATIFYQDVKGQSALSNAIHLLPCNLLGIFCGMVAMFLSTRINAPGLIACGCFVTSISSLLYAVIPARVSYWASGFIAQLFLPWGIDFTIGIGNILVASLVGKEDSSVGGAMFQTAYTLGNALGVALSGLVISQVGTRTGSISTGTSAAFWMHFAVSLAAGLVVMIGLRGTGLAKDARGKTDFLSSDRHTDGPTAA